LGSAADAEDDRIAGSVDISSRVQCYTINHRKRKFIKTGAVPPKGKQQQGLSG
jgi:hypothetical protein